MSIFNSPDDGPDGELARYAYGYSDKKPGWAFWLVHAVLAVVVIMIVTGEI